MFASLETWVERAKKLLERDPAEPDDRLPSEYVVAEFTLIGYQGPRVIVSAKPSTLKTFRIEAFLKKYARELNDRRYPAERINRDLQNLKELAEQVDAVEIIPAI